ncbi:MAG: Uma2 family endonuclease [Blastocatellia bacterium]
MSHTLMETPYKLDEDIQRELDAFYERVVTEDDDPARNLFSAKQQRLLVQPLYDSWTPPPAEDETEADAAETRRPFLADANVGVFYSTGQPPLVPDFFLSLDVRPHPDWYEKKHRSYFVWEFSKTPEIALEIVSNREGGELGRKPGLYARMGASYYVVYDPLHKLGETTLQVFELHGRQYQRRPDAALPATGLSLVLWQGVFEDKEDTWLRWCDHEGNLILTGQERAGKEAERADLAEQRAERLAAQLRALGIDPE